jgi:hypothetical protein
VFFFQWQGRTGTYRFAVIILALLFVTDGLLCSAICAAAPVTAGSDAEASHEHDHGAAGRGPLSPDHDPAKHDNCTICESIRAGAIPSTSALSITALGRFALLPSLRTLSLQPRAQQRPEPRAPPPQS